ncbi:MULTISPECIES: hypothetical protein [Nitrosomonas]|uniref:hypothetical protein n=1 Tax=Nitrosomonas TaxID=914 RepID=UPI000AA63D18|nr:MULTISPECIES: hypothetical protein [Nitrosomonas]UVS61348.1 hypothetical protein NX761_18045 [Nitrosomonas sp. PLL12]
MKELEPGWDVTPLYKNCPKCGCDLTKQFVNTDSSNGKPRKNKNYSGWFVIARIALSSGAKGIGCSWKESRLKRMIDQFSQANKKTTDRHQGSRNGREFGKKPGASKQENKKANHHENLVQVVKRKLGKRILHHLFGRG